MKRGATKIFYGIINSSKWKYKQKLVFPIVGPRLPIFWNRKIAEEFLESKSMGKTYEVVKLYLHDEGIVYY